MDRIASVMRFATFAHPQSLGALRGIGIGLARFEAMDEPRGPIQRGSVNNFATVTGAGPHWGLSVFLALLFIATGLSKLVSTDFMVKAFENVGYPTWLMYASGAVEVAGAVLIFAPRGVRLGVGLLWLDMAATAATLISTGRIAMGVFPLLMIFLLGVLLHTSVPLAKRTRRKLEEDRKEGADQWHTGSRQLPEH